MRWLAVSLLLGSVGCGTAVHTPPNLEVHEVGLRAVADDAVFWWSQPPGAVSFTVTSGAADDSILVRATSQMHNHGAAAEFDPNTREIRIRPEWDQNVNESLCVLAHEMGHVIGMEHVEQDGPSLMSSVVRVPTDGEVCYWSELDSAELERVRR